MLAHRPQAAARLWSGACLRVRVCKNVCVRVYVRWWSVFGVPTRMHLHILQHIKGAQALQNNASCAHCKVAPADLATPREITAQQLVSPRQHQLNMTPGTW